LHLGFAFEPPVVRFVDRGSSGTLPAYTAETSSCGERKGKLTMKRQLILLIVALIPPGYAYAGEVVVQMHAIDRQGVGKQIGTVTAADSAHGLILSPQLHGLAPGLHGFHVHENPNCDPDKKNGKSVAGLAAGGHYDPAKTGRHSGPYDGQGHLGDLPVLPVAQDGRATLPLLAPRLKADDLKGHALVIHAGGDNYSDQPEKLGGGGARVACGIVAP
jgi:superoxide dismutase, Cu-Zn family